MGTKRVGPWLVGLAMALVVSGCNSGSSLPAVPFSRDAMLGTWTGPWTNQTFGSQGTVSLAITNGQTASTTHFAVTLTGNVLGGQAPGQPLTMDSNDSGGGLSIDTNQAGLGHIVAAIDSTGHIQGTISNLANPAIQTVSFVGTATGNRISVNYQVAFANGTTATGVATITKTS